jgi:hypothetical protein
MSAIGRRTQDSPIQARWFGAVGDGVTNDTAALQRFLTSLSDGGIGEWGGTYLVDAGVLTLAPSADAQLIFANASLKLHKAPTILGDVHFVGSGSGTGPFLSIKNAPQTSTSGSYYGEGEIGNLTFTDNSGSQILTRHGLYVRGLFGWKIGVLIGNKLAGSVVSFSRDLAAGNPDPYTTQNCVFQGVRGEFCNGYAYDGDCLQDGGNLVVALGAGGRPWSGLVNDNGGMAQSGQGTEVFGGGVGGHYGWALVYGGGISGGNRANFKNLSMGAGEYGIWIQSLNQFHISGRLEGMTDQHSADPSLPAGAAVWPKTVLKIGGGGGSRAVSDGTIDLIVRVDEGTLGMLGSAPFLDMADEPNISDLDINIILIDNAGMGLISNSLLGIPVSTFIKNVASAASFKVKVNGFTVYSQRMSTSIRVRLANNAGSTAIPSSGYATADSKVLGNWAALDAQDFNSILDATNHWLNVTARGRYRVHCHMTLPVGVVEGTIAAGSLIRYALIDDNGSGGLSAIYEGSCLATNANGVTVVEMNVAAAILQANHRVWVSLTAAGQSGDCFLTFQTEAFVSAANVLELSLISPD